LSTELAAPAEAVALIGVPARVMTPLDDAPKGELLRLNVASVVEPLRSRSCAVPPPVASNVSKAFACASRAAVVMVVALPRVRAIAEPFPESIELSA
jgi:hypothetical protein